VRICPACSKTFDAISWHCPYCGSQPEERGGFPAFAAELASNAGFKDAHFQVLVSLEARNFWFRARNRLIVWALQRYFQDKENFLEIGCGTGFVLSGLSAACPHLKLAGSEISSAGLAYAAKRVPGAEFFQMDARAIPFAGEFDVIGALDVLEHIEEDEKVLGQLHRAIRTGGGLLITVPQHEFLWSRMDVHACHVRRYAARDLVSKVQTAGFEIVRLTSFVSLLLPLMLASRLRQRYEEESYDPLAELRIGATTNVLLEKVMDIERVLIQAGISFPIGGSLMMIARKM
jgi:SAM-dependent methyltransferase